MKTFHSSGTPIGIAVRIARWKHTITAAATAVTQPPWEKNNTTGTHISTVVPPWATIRDRRPGRRSSGNLSKKARFIDRARISGLLDIIVEITKGKWWLSLDVAAPIQITTNTALDATIMSTPGNRNVTASEA